MQNFKVYPLKTYTHAHTHTAVWGTHTNSFITFVTAPYQHQPRVTERVRADFEDACIAVGIQIVTTPTCYEFEGRPIGIKEKMYKSILCLYVYNHIRDIFYSVWSPYQINLIIFTERYRWNLHFGAPHFDLNIQLSLSRMRLL